MTANCKALLSQEDLNNSTTYLMKGIRIYMCAFRTSSTGALRTEANEI